MLPAYPRAETERRLCDAVEAGASLADLAERPGFPSRQTVHRWTLTDPAFAARLEEARNARRGLKTALRAGPDFDEAWAEAFLLQVRRGEAVRDLVRREGQPGRRALDRWKRERPDFAAALAQAARFAFEERPLRWARYDEAAADAIILRVSKGEPLPRVLADPALPGETAVRRWRAREPAFDAALRAAHRAGHRRRMAGRTRLTRALFDEILTRMTRGASLSEVCRDPIMPHYVTVMGWKRRDPGMARMLAWARDEGRVARALGQDDYSGGVAAGGPAETE